MTSFSSRRLFVLAQACFLALAGFFQTPAQAKDPSFLQKIISGKAGDNSGGEDIQPQVSEVFKPLPPVEGKDFMAVTPHPLATKAAVYVLENGGSAADAAIAAGAMLTLVEPHASGIGGGGFLLHYDAASRKTTVYDGRETAPASAKPSMFLGKDGKPREFYDMVPGGLSVGIPGLVAMFEKVHQAHGTARWYSLWRLAAEQARAGFRVTPTLAGLLEDEELLEKFPDSKAYFSDEEGNWLQEGALLKNEALAETLSGIAINGAKSFYLDTATDSILEAVNNSPVNPGVMTISDFVGYQPVVREPVCGAYRAYRVCGMPPPSAGGLVTLQVLKMLERYPLDKQPQPFTADSVHVLTEALRLAYADRDTYIADPAFAPGGTVMSAMLNPSYVALRGKAITLDKSIGIAQPGELPLKESSLPMHRQVEPASTSHISIVDKKGNAVALTQSIENIFGSRLMASGFLLNNQLTDFSFVPTKDGQPVANAAAAGKRPRSSMSPTLVFEKDSGRLRYVVGSPGGARITPYVLKTLVALLDWNMPANEAVNAGNLSNRNGQTELEEQRFPAALAEDLRQRGQEVVETNLTSGLNIIALSPDGTLVGAADPRREGRAIGQ